MTAPAPFTAEQLAAREAIRDLAIRYARGVDRLDVELMKSSYWPDATDDHGVFVGNAHEFCERVVATHGRFRFTMHSIFTHAVEIDDEASARGEVYNMTTLFRDEPDGTTHRDTWHGRYLDRYEQRGGEWRIIERVCVHEGTSTEPVTAMPIDAARFRQGSADRAIPGRPIGP